MKASRMIARIENWSGLKCVPALRLNFWRCMLCTVFDPMTCPLVELVKGSARCAYAVSSMQFNGALKNVIILGNAVGKTVGIISIQDSNI
jgi:hypothetical protein